VRGGRVGQRRQNRCLEKVADQLAELLRLEPLLGPSPSGPQLSNISDRNPFFTSREQFLGELCEALANRGRAALSGSGGIGKTQTAVEYAHQHSVEYAYAFWATAALREALLSSYVVIAGLLKLPEFDAKKQTLIVEVVMRWLASHDRWLLILDNVDRPDTIKPFIPLKPTGHIVLTSRAQVFDAIGIVKPVELNVMSSEEGQTFLLKLSEDCLLRYNLPWLRRQKECSQEL
jgi:hypothetical protein